jgi:hypothetical protein
LIPAVARVRSALMLGPAVIAAPRAYDAIVFACRIAIAT